MNRPARLLIACFAVACATPAMAEDAGQRERGPIWKFFCGGATQGDVDVARSYAIQRWQATHRDVAELDAGNKHPTCFKKALNYYRSAGEV